MSASRYPHKLRLETVVLICGAIIGLLLFYEFFFSSLRHPGFDTHWRLIQRLP
jgi:hypothetical protein